PTITHSIDNNKYGSPLLGLVGGVRLRRSGARLVAISHSRRTGLLIDWLLSKNRNVLRHERSLLVPGIVNYVILHLCFQRKCYATGQTRERLHRVSGANMREQSSAKASDTVWTRVGIITFMSEHVIGETMFASNFLATLRAFEHLHLFIWHYFGLSRPVILDLSNIVYLPLLGYLNDRTSHSSSREVEICNWFFLLDFSVRIDGLLFDFNLLFFGLTHDANPG
ncbi:hypothetical protein PMAYCL1PPCAC_26896, partial [Pristionchus mayeri]